MQFPGRKTPCFYGLLCGGELCWCERSRWPSSRRLDNLTPTLLSLLWGHRSGLLAHRGCYHRLVAHKQEEEGKRWRDKSSSFLGELVKSLVDCGNEGRWWTVEGRGEESAPAAPHTSSFWLPEKPELCSLSSPLHWSTIQLKTNHAASGLIHFNNVKNKSSYLFVLYWPDMVPYYCI